MDESQVKKRMDQSAGQRAQNAAALRVAGMPWATIAEQTGFAHATHCARAVKTYFGSLPQPDRDASRQLWRERIEWLWTKAVRDVEQQRPGAIRSATALVQRAAALDGIDVPTQLELLTPTDVQTSQLVTELLALRREQLGLAEALEADPFSSEYIDAEVIEEPQEAERPA